MIDDRETGRSRGFGFVEMDNDEEALEAIRNLDGSELDGRTIVVKKAEPRENRGGGNRGGGFRDRGGDYRGGNRGGNRYDRNSW